ncbi:hypothetical protein ACFC1R_23520 [Kitasatospora sp. NPDC056138]|uniref:hypothetical protein n=1 Tax=Kitasatospora sp. NPDC056138 TaxID=3345724 RepID=UPI0035E1B2B4
MLVEGDVQAAVVPGTGDAPAAGTHRGPRQVDVRAGAGALGTLALGLLVGSALAGGVQLGLVLPLGTLALGLLVGSALAGGVQLGLVLPLGLLTTPQELGAALGSLALQLQSALAGGFAAAGGFLAAGKRGQGLGLRAGGPGLGEFGAVVPPDGEHGVAVCGGDEVAVVPLLEEPGGEGQVHHLAAYAAAHGPEVGPGGDEAVAGAVPPHPAFAAWQGGRRDEVVPTRTSRDLGVPRGTRRPSP